MFNSQALVYSEGVKKRQRIGGGIHMKGRKRWGGDILKADVHAIHDTIGHVVVISGAIVFSGCVGTRVALGDTSGQDLFLLVTSVPSQIPTSFFT